MDESTLDWLTDCILDALARGQRVRPAALRFLLRRLVAPRRADLEEPLGAALALELDRAIDRAEDDDRDQWLALFSEAATVSDDPRLPQVAADLLPAVRTSWGNTVREVDSLMHAVDACLRSLNIAAARDLAAEAVDALERAVARAYLPGRGMAHRLGDAPCVPGGARDHVYSASALLTAYTITGRLPYAMLADELMQVVRRGAPDEDATFAVECDAASVCCRLAALHRDEEYRRAAVLAAGADYAREAMATLQALAPAVRGRRVEAAPFGLALAEWLDLG